MEDWFRVGGHILAPLSDTMRHEGFAIPEGFNAKTKLVPDWNELEEQIKEELKMIEEDVRRKTQSEGGGKGKGSRLGEGVNWEKIRRVYDEMVWECEGGVEESVIKEFKERTAGFVVAPVDKYTQEMAIM